MQGPPHGVLRLVRRAARLRRRAGPLLDLRADGRGKTSLHVSRDLHARMGACIYVDVLICEADLIDWGDAVHRGET